MKIRGAKNKQTIRRFWYNSVRMNKTVFATILSLVASAAGASWYWPFGSDEEKPQPPRMSELMEPASLLIDSASDLADEGKTDEAVAVYRKALAELERLEIENPERSATSEFSTVRNKKAYVEASIDSLLLDQARSNARAVAVTDTSKLQEEYASMEENRRKEASIKPSVSPRRDTEAQGESGATFVARKGNGGSGTENAGGADADAQADGAAAEGKNAAGAAAKAASARKDRLRLANSFLVRRDYASAHLAVDEMLEENPGDAAALNMRAAIETAEGRFDAARATLSAAIKANPRSHHAYYNLAKLILRTEGDGGRETAKRYYETGRKFCSGPEDPILKELAE